MSDIGGYDVSPPFYGTLLQMLIDNVPSAQGRVLVALEGGYNTKCISSASYNCMKNTRECREEEKRK